VTYDITYNGLGQATRHYSYTSGTDIADFEYEYDDNGNITKQEFNHRDSTPYNDYDYDDLDRLTDADYLVGVLTEDEQFTYDDLGNRTNVNLRSGSDESYSVDNLTNRYNSVGGNSLDYDDAGNLTQDPNGYEYEYDYENRLIEITKGETTIAEYEYDALGRRIEKTDSVANETTRYYYDNDWRVLAEYDDNDTQLRDFIYGNYIDEVLVMTDSNEDAYYYFHNHIYSSIALIDENGNVVERYEYNAYGSPTIYNNDFSQTYDVSQYGNPFFLTGRQMDSLDSDALRLGYNRTRYLDYYTGRWLSHDPLGVIPADHGYNIFAPKIQYALSSNLFKYVSNQPINDLDPYGLIDWGKLWDAILLYWSFNDEGAPFARSLMRHYVFGGGSPYIRGVLYDYSDIEKPIRKKFEPLPLLIPIELTPSEKELVMKVLDALALVEPSADDWSSFMKRRPALKEFAKIFYKKKTQSICDNMYILNQTEKSCVRFHPGIIGSSTTGDILSMLWTLNISDIGVQFDAYYTAGCKNNKCVVEYKYITWTWLDLGKLKMQLSTYTPGIFKKRLSDKHFADIGLGQQCPINIYWSDPVAKFEMDMADPSSMRQLSGWPK